LLISFDELSSSHQRQNVLAKMLLRNYWIVIGEVIRSYWLTSHRFVTPP
jgi:hypothetical protein